MNRITKITLGVALAVLLGVAAFWIRWRTLPPVEADVASAATPVEAVSATTARDAALPGSNIPEPIATEDSWARELRELKVLAAADPDRALSRASRIADPHARKGATRAVCLVIAATDPAKATNAAWNAGLGQFDDESAENHVLELLARRWAEADLVKAFAWASALPGDEEGRRDHLLKGIAAVISQVAPAEAARVVTEQISSDSSVRIEAAMQVLRDWSLQEYPSALAWVSRLDGPLRERGMDELANVRTIESQRELNRVSTTP